MLCNPIRGVEVGTRTLKGGDDKRVKSLKSKTPQMEIGHSSKLPQAVAAQLKLNFSLSTQLNEKVAQLNLPGNPIVQIQLCI